MFKKKFKVRVRLFSWALRSMGYPIDDYEVQYAYYRFIPVYHTLCFWFDQGVTSKGCWSPSLFKYKEAEALASSLKSIEDVAKYYEPFEAEEKAFKKMQSEHFAKNTPYATKYF